MKKKILASFLALCLVLALLPAPAAAGTEYWIDMSAEEARTMLDAVAGAAETRYIVFVYYDASTAPNPVESQFRPFANEKGYYIYGYNASSGGSLADALAPLFDGNTALTLPVAVTWNPSTKSCMVGENARTLNTGGGGVSEFTGLQELMAANGLERGSSAPSTPAPPETTPPDPGTTEPEPPSDASGSSVPGVNAQAWEVLRLLNIYRMEKGLLPLSTFAGVQEAANIRARELFFYCSHTRPDGSDYSTVFAEVGLRSMTSWAENIASGQRDAADVMNSWKRSPGHNANMIKPTGRVHVGIGYDYQTNGDPSLYASNWVQNFVAAYDCSFTGLRLSRSSIEGEPGTDLETLLREAEIEVTADCYRHGKSSLPLIAAMCSGYDADQTGDQTLTVTYGGQTAQLVITGADHTHRWTETTTPATCTDPGRKTSVCSECGRTEEEAVPATGHRFITQEDGSYICENCSIQIPVDLETAYEALTENAEQYLNGVEGIDLSTDESAIQDYLEQQAEAALEGTAYICEVLDGTFNEDHTRYEYRIGVKALEVTEPQALSARRSYLPEDYILITEPLVLFLNLGDGDAPTVEEAPDVATPDGNVSVEDTPEPEPPVGPSEPSEPVPPSGPSLPSRPSGSPSAPAAPAYSISAPRSTGGQVTLDRSSATRGQRVTVSVQPGDGYVLDTLRVIDADGNEVALRPLEDGKYEFTMPGSEVILQASFAQVLTEPVPEPVPMLFADVSAGDWFYSSVDYVWKHLWMTGVTETRFAPGETVSRAMLWTILARMHGVPTGTDPQTAWYEPGQLWAMQQSVSDGTDPAGDVTREQIAAMLWRDAGRPAATADLSGFQDGGLVSDYAQAAMGWAVETGVLQGADGMLGPQDPALRAELAAMLCRYAALNGQ